MSRVAAWLAWSVGATSLALLVTGMTFSQLLRSVAPSENIPLWLELVFYVGFAAYPVVGALVVSRRPENAVGWLLCAVGLAIAVEAFTEAYALYADAISLAGAEAAAFLYGINPGVLLAIFVPLLFPDGRLPSRRWRPVVWLVGGSIAVYVVHGALKPEGPDPLGIVLPDDLSQVLSVLSLVLGVGSALGSVASVALRLKGARGQERQQIKWLVYAASVAAVSILGASLLPSPLDEVFWFVTVFGFAAMPVAVGVAILRYRLYDIDVLINRTLVYGSLTAMLAAVYFGGVTVTEAIFRALRTFITGQEEPPQLAVVISTLVIAALFNPLRRRIQSFIDRRFYRSKYDAAKTLEAFSAKLRDETDLDALSADLVSVVRETMQPAHVSLWLRPDTASKKEEATG